MNTSSKKLYDSIKEAERALQGLSETLTNTEQGTNIDDIPEAGYKEKRRFKEFFADCHGDAYTAACELMKYLREGRTHIYGPEIIFDAQEARETYQVKKYEKTGEPFEEYETRDLFEYPGGCFLLAAGESTGQIAIKGTEIMADRWKNGSMTLLDFIDDSKRLCGVSFLKAKTIIYSGGGCAGSSVTLVPDTGERPDPIPEYYDADIIGEITDKLGAEPETVIELTGFHQNVQELIEAVETATDSEMYDSVRWIKGQEPDEMREDANE